MVAGPSLLIGNQAAVDFIQEHEKADPYGLSLKYSRIAGIPFPVIGRQIESRRKARKKLPEWYHHAGIIFPDPANLRQCSSEATARYKATLVSTHNVTDLTGGTGIDLFYLAEGGQAIFIDPSNELGILAAHNFAQFDREIRVITSTAEIEAAQLTIGHQLYLDPSRRDSNNRKLTDFRDCLPDATSLLPNLLRTGNAIMIKGSPMIDIRMALRSLNDHVSAVHVLEWEGECREILFIAEKSPVADPVILAGDTTTITNFSFRFSEENDTDINYSDVDTFLYEPSPSILKAGAFRTVAARYELCKLHPNTHLYTSSSYQAEFPGRVFKVHENIPYQKKLLKSVLPEGKANISVRNFPESVAAIRKKTGLSDGGDRYVFAYTARDGKKMICITERPDNR